MKPSTTLMVVIQEPDFGADFNHEGNIAKMVNGRAKAKAKANMPMAGASQLPVVVVCTSNMPIIGPVQEKDTSTKVKAIASQLPVVVVCTSNMPIIGPVQEKDTSTKVKAIRKILTRPLVCEAFVSTLFAQLSGSLISNHPKKLQAKTTSNRNRNTLNTALVESEFSVSDPKMAVTNSPNPT